MTTGSYNITRRINRLWRIFATGFVFVLFGVGAIVISLTMFPVLRLVSADSESARRRIQHAMQLTFKAYVEVMRLLRVMTHSVEGVERLRERGRLIVANHPTLLDVVVLVSLMPEVDCIVKRGLWRNPFLRWPVLWASYIPNSEGEELVDSCAERLRLGHSLLVFPEGTRTVPGEPIHMQRGAARIALAADAEILPVTVTCDPPTLYKGLPWYRVPERRFHMAIVVGQPLSAANFRHGDEPARAARRLTEWLRAYYDNNDASHPAEDAEQVKSADDAARAASSLY